jgi:hypothetical protein
LEYLRQCEIPDLPVEPEPNHFPSTPPSPVLEDGLIDEDSEPSSDVDNDAHRLKMAHIHLQSTLHVQEDAQPEVTFASDAISSCEHQDHDLDDNDDIMSDIVVESLTFDQDQDLISEDPSSIDSQVDTRSDMSEDVWLFTESPNGEVQAGVTYHQLSDASLLLGSPPHSLIETEWPETATFSNEWKLPDDKGYNRSSISIHDKPVQLYDGDGANAMDYDDEEVYDF